MAGELPVSVAQIYVVWLGMVSLPAWVTFVEANAPYPGSSGGQAELPDKAKEAPPSCGCLLSNENSGLDRTPTARNGSKISRTYMLLHQANKFPSQENNTITIYICTAKRKCCTSCYLLPLSEAFAMILAKVFGDIARSLAGSTPCLPTTSRLYSCFHNASFVLCSRVTGATH